MKIFNAISILVVVAFLAPTMTAAQVKKSEKTTLSSGKYRYYADKVNNVNCQNSKEWVCISIEEFKELCANEEGLTGLAAKYAITTREGYRDKGALYLIENDGNVKFSAKWKENKEAIGKSCFTSLTFKGIFEGSQFNKTFEGYADTFLVTEKGAILVHEISKFR
jgi:hypothetical protein